MEEGDPKLVEEDLKTYNDCCKQRAVDLKRGSEPSLIVRTATELSSLTSFCDVPVPDPQVLELDEEEGRPRARVSGLLFTRASPLFHSRRAHPRSMMLWLCKPEYLERARTRCQRLAG